MAVNHEQTKANRLGPHPIYIYIEGERESESKLEKDK